MDDWKEILVPLTATIGDAIGVLESSTFKTCLIVDEAENLKGTVTDGDIRRGMLRSLGLDDPVEQIMNRSPQVLRRGQEQGDTIQMMTALHVNLIPILDDGDRVVGLEVLDQFAGPGKPCENWVVLMAGGLGTRLRPVTDTMPKPLVRVGNKPLMETTLESFISQGFSRFYISVNYKSEMIRKHFGDGGKWNVEIRYVEEDKRMGTAGALRLLSGLPDAPLIIMNADVLTRINFGDLLTYHHHHDSRATMCVREYNHRVPFGVVQIDEHRITGIDEKPIQICFVNAGIYVLAPEMIDLIPEDERYDMTTLFERIIEAGHSTAVFPIREYWVDVGRMDDLDQANSEFPGEFEQES